MREMILIMVLVLASISDAWAQNQKTIKELVGEVKHASSDTVRKTLKQRLWEQTPQTAEDIEVLAQELEGPLAPLAQKILSKTTSRDLVPALINASEKKAIGLKNLTENDFAKMGAEERSREIDRQMGLITLISTLGSIKDPRAIGTLKKYLDYEGLQFAASTALSRMGDEAIFRELLERSKTQRHINIANIKDRHLREIVAEFDRPGMSAREQGRLLSQIKGSKDPAVNGVLRELILTHKNSDVRLQAGMAMFNSILADPNAADEVFIVQWISTPGRDVFEDIGKNWAILAMKKNYRPRYSPLLISMLQNNLADCTRADAARLLGEQMVYEAVPYLEHAMRYDEDSGVRGACFGALRNITGRPYLFSHPDDVKGRIIYFKEYPADRKLGENYPEEQNNAQ